MLLNHLKFIFIWVLLLFGYFHSEAQLSNKLDSIFITASRIPGHLSESGKSVTVISENEIKNLHVNSVDELLRLLPGLNVNSRNAFGVQSDIGMRGSTFSQVLVLVDNLRLNDPLTNHFNQNIPVSLAEIGQIEVIRGPSAVSFGPDAVGGVIHIKTKSYLAEYEGKTKISTQGEAGIGENNLSLIDAGLFAQFDKLSISAGVKSLISDGEVFSNPNFALGSSKDSTFRSFFDLKTYSMSMAVFPSQKWKIYSRFGLDKRNFNAKYFYTRSNFDESIEETQSRWGQMAISRRSGKHQTELNLGHKSGEDIFTFNPLFSSNQHNTGLTSLLFNHNYQLNERSSLSMGVQFERRSIESNDRGDHENSSGGIYALVSQHINDKLKIISGVRLQTDNNFGTEFLPQFNWIYSLDKIIFRSSFGRSIRAGDFTERYISSNISNLSPGRNLGNPNLKAETSNSFDLGINYFGVQSITFSSTFFLRQSDNLIDYIITNSIDIPDVTNLTANEEYFYASNISSSQTLGWESEVMKTWEFLSEKKITAAMNYTHLKTSSESKTPSKYISNHPRHNLNLTLSYLSPLINLSISNSFIKRNPEQVEIIHAEIKSSYFLTHLRFDLKPIRENASIFLKIHNVFDHNYQEILGAQMPGRWVMAGVQWDFHK